jgi:hypothetical protein
LHDLLFRGFAQESIILIFWHGVLQERTGNAEQIPVETKLSKINTEIKIRNIPVPMTTISFMLDNITSRFLNPQPIC